MRFPCVILAKLFVVALVLTRTCIFSEYRLVGLVVKASASRAEDPEFESRLRRDFSGVKSHQWLKKLALQRLPYQAPGVVGSVLGLVGPVSIYWDWVRWKVWSATSISVWQRVKLFEQIRPWDTLACCWDVKQASKQATNISVNAPHQLDRMVDSEIQARYNVSVVLFKSSRLLQNPYSFKRCVTCPTRSYRIMCLCHGSIPFEYKSRPLPPAWASDHDTVHLIPS